MEYGSVLELDNLSLYRISETQDEIRLPFMKEEEGFHTLFYQSGRNAIEALFLLLKKDGIKEVIMPDYVCSTVSDAAIRAGVEIVRYSLKCDYSFDVSEIKSKINDNNCLYICHYFGTEIRQETLKAIKEIQKSGVTVIEDITLSLLSKGAGIGFGDYILGSLRKWFPIPDGGILISKTKELPEAPARNAVSRYTDLYFAVQMMKKIYADGGYEDKELKNVYMGYYGESIKELFSDYKIYPMSDYSYNYLKNADIKAICERRKENYDALYNLLKDAEGIRCKVERKEENIPFGMVIECESRDEVLKKCIDNDLYCNVHWRLELEAGTEGDYLSKRSITVPCDQRYTVKDMEIIAQIIKSAASR